MVSSFGLANDPVVVAVIDSPVETTHRLLKAAVDEDLMDSLKHTDSEGNEVSWKTLNDQILAKLKNQVKEGKYQEQLEFIENFRKRKDGEAFDAKSILIGTIKYRISSKYRSQIDLIGTYLHGTHIAGLAIKSLSNIKLITYPIHGDEKKQTVSEVLNYDDTKERGSERQKWENISKGLKDSNAKIVNLSFGMTEQNILDILNAEVGLFVKFFAGDKLKEYAKKKAQMLQEEFQRFVDSNPDRAFVIAAGNDSSDLSKSNNAMAKIKGDNVVVVGATNRQDKISALSNYSSKDVDIAVLGDSVKSALIEGGEIKMSGTSMAAPIVSNFIARKLQENPNATPQEAIKSVLNEAKRVSRLEGQFVDGRIIPFDVVANSDMGLEDIPQSKLTIDKIFTPSVLKDISNTSFDHTLKLDIQFKDATVSTLTGNNELKFLEISTKPSKALETQNFSLQCKNAKASL